MEAIAMEVTNSHHATSSSSSSSSYSSSSSSSSMSPVEQQSPLATPLDVDSKQRRCNGETSTPDQLPFSLQPDMLHHILTSFGLESQHLASFEATCLFTRAPSNLDPCYPELSIVESAALDMCNKRVAIMHMGSEERESFKQRCGGSWKLVLKFLMTGEACCRRGKCQAISGPEHSIVVTTSGKVYSFGNNSSGELGHGNLKTQHKPKLIRHLQGIRIVQAATGAQRTMLVSDEGRVYAVGKNTYFDFSEPLTGPKFGNFLMVPKLVESLRQIFVIQVSIGNYFTAVLSREGRVYTFCWGSDARLGHACDPNDKEPRLLLGPLEDKPVAQIATGNCFLLALAFHPSGMSVYSVGCGRGGKLGHGTIGLGLRDNDEHYPRLIEQFQVLNLKPVRIAAAAWHAAVLGEDGRVCTWGWGYHGCLGHGDENFSSVPRVVEALSAVKAVHIETGYHSTFVVDENGDVYSFGCNEFSNLGHIIEDDESVMEPELATTIKQAMKNERIVQISTSNTNGSGVNWGLHTFLLTDAGKLYALGSGHIGQLGVQLPASDTIREIPELVDVDLN